MVVPLRIGGGSRLKIIEAAANGLPVASTRIGAEGLSFDPRQDYFQAENIDELHEPVIKALSDPELRQARAERACEKAEREYEWEALAQTQDAIWRAACQKTT